jgi:lipopolysaccharide exporter
MVWPNCRCALVRLVTVILIARQLSPDIVGVAALSLTVFELVRVLANVGVGQRIIAADAARLDATCNTAHRLFWLWCGGVALVQVAVAGVLWLGFDQPLAAQMLAVLALVYLFMPGGLVSCYLLMREGRAATTARTVATQTIADHILSAALLLLWQSPWSIILPKLLTAPIWLVLTRRARPGSLFAAAGTGACCMALLRFGLPVLATEMMAALRVQLDKLIIAASFGVTTLGTWFFAFNAGIGIASSLITAFGTLAFPALCAGDGADARRRLKMVAAMGLLIFVPMVLAQSLLAPLYVPIIFGAHWTHAIPLIATLCLAGIPMICATITTAWLRASGRPGRGCHGGPGGNGRRRSPGCGSAARRAPCSMPRWLGGRAPR